MKSKKDERLGEERVNNQGCLMKIVEYNSTSDIVVEFQDEYNARVHTAYQTFLNKSVKNPYYPSVCGVGIVGNKYPTHKGYKTRIKECKTWESMLLRSFKNKQSSYNKITCCNEWLYYENFYEWLHNQENFDKWINGDDWALDKDILFKGNKIYSPDKCCLVPRSVNNLFIKRDSDRGKYPIGITKHNNMFRARCDNPILGIRQHIGLYETSEKAFIAYKNYKENIIKKVAQIEFESSNITKRCYEAMMNYKVEITD